MTIQRLYLATIPPYQALLLDLVSLALWKDQKRSFLCCACFWMLWYHDLLLAALLCRMLWCLLRYRLLPYPSLEELQAKRRNAAQARRFGEEIQQQLSTSTLGPVDVWRLFRYYNKVTPESNAKKSAKGKYPWAPEWTMGGLEQLFTVDPNGDKTILEHSEDSQEALDLKRELLHILDIIADLHERIRNILTWRRPAVTRRYVIVSFGELCIGIASPSLRHFRHMKEHGKIPPIFGDAPTDAEYAMDLIGERVASGQDIKLHHKRSNHHIHVANASNNVGSTTVESSCYDPSEDKDGVNWKKWGARIAQGKSLLEDSKPISSIGRVVRDKLLPEKQAISDSSEVEQTYTFPAQHSSALGLITLTPSTVYFTSVTSIRPKLVIPRNQLRGVKKTGLMKGLSIRWISADQEAQGEENLAYQGFHTLLLLSSSVEIFTISWLLLAATLGPKSAFRKLPKRSVLSADIAQLCELIATPVEPLALRLSSNLLVGAARSKVSPGQMGLADGSIVKQDIFMTDVTACFNSLKRVIDECRSATTSEAQLQMTQPSVKPSAVTLRIDPDAAFALELDNVLGLWLDSRPNSPQGWGEYSTCEGSSSDDYDPKPQKGKRKAKTSVSQFLSTEAARVKAHTLDENHEFLTKDSFDASFGEPNAAVKSSSELGGFRFDDAFFEPFDGFDMNEGIGDDLLRELGEGWGSSPTNQKADEDTHLNEVQADLAFSITGMDYDMHVTNDGEVVSQDTMQLALVTLNQNAQDQQVQLPPISISASLQTLQFSHASPDKPHVKNADDADRGEVPLPNKTKRARLVFDGRIEFTEEEFKAARMHYLEGQDVIRRKLHIKNIAKERGGLIHNLLWSVPDNVHAKELANFWIDHYKMRVEARSGFHLDVSDANCRRKKMDTSETPTLGGDFPNALQEMPAPGDSPTANLPAPLEADLMDFAFEYDPESTSPLNVNFAVDGNRLRLSEEPGQGRHASHPLSTLGEDLGAEVYNSLSSRRSGLFPWDNAGNSPFDFEQEGGFQPQDSNKMSVDHAETRLGGISGDNSGMTSDASRGSADLPALEKNSSNFLEYARMQHRSLSSSFPNLTFDDVVPKATSTAHVAAAALYHCLVLGTKDLIQLQQEEPHGQIIIRIK
ncbi:hypothetical protein V8B97DRAFT_1918138 [Scleroderma yunnanense]